MDLTNEDVTDILALLDSLPYDELDLQTTRFRLTLRRTPDGWTQSTESRGAPTALPAAQQGAATERDLEARGPQAPSIGAGGPHTPANAADAGDSLGARGPQAPSSGAGGPHTPANAADAGRELAGRELAAERELVEVRAPLPGTFYRAPRPGAAPFVEVGSQVAADTVVGIVETMKLMNSVTAGVDGIVAEICVANAEFAPHGTTLLRVRAD